MKSGFEMMLSSMGIDLEPIKEILNADNVKQLVTRVHTMCENVEEIRAAVNRIEIKLGTLPESVAMKLLADGQSNAFKETVEFVRGYNGNNGNGSCNNRDICIDANENESRN